MKQIYYTILLTLFMGMFGSKANAHDIEVANKDGVPIYYVWVNDNTELAVSFKGTYSDSYNDEYSDNIVIPESVEYLGKTYNVISIGMYAFSDSKNLTSVTIPNSIISIEDYAFARCSKITSFSMPNSVKSIGKCVFFHCSSLNSINISNSLISIGESAFNGCSSLTSLDIPNSVTFIDKGVFYECTGLETVLISNSVSNISNYTFQLCSSLRSVTIPESVNTIGSEAFYGCSSLTSVIIPSSVTEIGLDAFAGCGSLHEIQVPVNDFLTFCNNTTVSLIHSNTYKSIKLVDDKGKEIKEYIIPDGVKTISGNAFCYCTGLISVIISNSVTSIGSNAFEGCNNLEFVVVGSGVTSIGKNAFPLENNYNQTPIVKKTIWLTNTPPEGAWYAAGAINYVANDQYNFSNKVVYPFLSSYFDVDGIRYVPVSLSDKTCDAIDCLYDESAKDIMISSTVTNKGVTLSVKNIMPYIGYGNNYIESLVIDDNISSIGEQAFNGCSSIKEIRIKPAITEIGNSAFSNCTNLKKFIIEDSDVELKLGAKIVESCQLDSVYIGRNVNYPTSDWEGYSPFYRNTSLRAVKITDKETEISENEFYGCTNLQRVIIGDGVTSIGNRAFSGCSSLKFFTFGSEVKTIGQEAFSDCTAVTEITSRAIEPPTCGAQALDDINKWDCKLYVPKGYLASYQAAEQWKEFLFVEEGDYTIAKKYTLTYMVDGEEYKSYQIAEGSAITPEAAPTKDGYVFSGWSTIPATMPAEDVTISGSFSLLTDEDVILITSAGQSTWCSKYDLDFTGVEGLKAYTATGYDRISGTIWLTRVYQVPANEGIFLMGNTDEYHVPHKSTGTYYANLMVGTLQPITINETDGGYTNYYLSNGDSGVGFYKVNGSVDLKANRAYLPLLKGSVQAGTRFIGIEFENDGTTSIKGLTPVLSEGEGEWYTLQGQRVAKPGKGLYIHNGKKVVIK